jgi:hypothetical protein
MIFTRAISIFVGAVALVQLPLAGQTHVNAGSAIQALFQQRISAYMKLRKAALEGVPPASKVTKQGDVVDKQRRLAAQIRQARVGARQGDICSPEIAAELKHLIAVAMGGGDASRIRTSLRNSEPVTLPLKVNDSFPESLPLQSTPPTLLLNLPELPQELEYRIVGRALVVLDSQANIIVDFVPDALSP